MTTETATRSAHRGRPAPTGARLLVRSAALTGALGLLAAAVAATLDGAPGALGVLVGTGLVLVVLLGGSLVVDAVAAVLPVASLLVALLTFGLQVLAVLVVLSALDGSGLVGATLDRGWLGGAVVGATMLWLAVQVRLHTSARIPVFDEPRTQPVGPREGGPR